MSSTGLKSGETPTSSYETYLAPALRSIVGGRFGVRPPTRRLLAGSPIVAKIAEAGCGYSRRVSPRLQAGSSELELETMWFETDRSLQVCTKPTRGPRKRLPLFNRPPPTMINHPHDAWHPATVPGCRNTQQDVEGSIPCVVRPNAGPTKDALVDDYA